MNDADPFRASDPLRDARFGSEALSLRSALEAITADERARKALMRGLDPRPGLNEAMAATRAERGLMDAASSLGVRSALEEAMGLASPSAVRAAALDALNRSPELGVLAQAEAKAMAAWRRECGPPADLKALTGAAAFDASRAMEQASGLSATEVAKRDIGAMREAGAIAALEAAAKPAWTPPPRWERPPMPPPEALPRRTFTPPQFPTERQPERAQSLGALLLKISPSLVQMLRGAERSHASDHPDRHRHTSSSLREIVLRLIRIGAPDDQVRAWVGCAEYLDEVGNISRRTRVFFVLRRQLDGEAGKHVRAVIPAMLEAVQVVNTGTHGAPGVLTEEEFDCTVTTLKGYIELLARAILAARAARQEEPPTT